MTLIKDSFKIYFHEMEKLLPVEKVFDDWKKMVFTSQKMVSTGHRMVSTSQNKRIYCKNKYKLGGKKI